jgi:hypothetical protein
MSNETYTSIRQLLAITLCCLLFTFLQCVSLQANGGTGSETVIGKLIQEDGTPAGETIVTLYPSNFNPVLDSGHSTYHKDTTDGEGKYEITFKSSGIKKFTLQAVSLPQKTRAIIENVDISSPGEQISIATASLHKTGRIKVITSDSSVNRIGYVFIPGTTYHNYVENGYAIIDSVPADIIPQVYFSDETRMGELQSLAEAVDIKPEMTNIITFSGSAHAKKIFLNTTPDGADITGNLLGFPLLIRLSSNNFSFKEARVDGSDLRFTKSDNIPLAFEIERWDSVAQLAEIWVKIDTIYGNNSSQSVVMYWGEPATTISINHSKVFDTANGFRGVWHLSEEKSGVGTKGLYKDAAGLNNGDDYISATDRSGIIGYGHAFDGVDDYIQVNSPVTNFNKGNLTIALWAKIQDSGGTILSKLDTVKGWNIGESSLYLGNGTDTFDLPGSNGSFLSFVSFNDDYAISAQSVLPNDWHYLVYTWEWVGDSTGTPQYYIDGTKVPLSRDSLIIRHDENANVTLRIGQPNNNESFAYFKGLMDELEISSTARSAEWIKLCYMNQREEKYFIKY